jgi:magnesium transporter
MLNLYLANGEVVKLKGVEDASDTHTDFQGIQFLDYTPEDLNWAKEHFNIDLSIMSNTEDIEISSHFYETEDQSVFHFSLPYYIRKNRVEEESLFLVLTRDKVFTFTSSSLDTYLSEIYSVKRQAFKSRPFEIVDFFTMYVEFLAGYYADITENMARRIKHLAARVLVKKEFNDNNLDIVTLYNFNNLLIKESVNEFVRILTLFKKSGKEATLNVREKIDSELNDLATVADYIQFNFDRLDDLKENIGSKIDLEQSRIFKILTMVTVCIALPTMISGIYGMNFEVMPLLKWKFGYPFALFTMLLSFIIPIFYFKKKKWL